MCQYVIYNLQDHTYWSNSFGWVGLEEASFYDETDRNTLNLPIGGRWVPLWEVDYLQAVRLIAELEGLDKLGEGTCYAVAEEMGLDVSEVYDIIDRAKTKFDSFKQRM